MKVTLTPRSEDLLKELARSAGTSPEELIERALESYKRYQERTKPRKTVAEAVEHILESRERVKLGGLKIKDLIEEGRKY